MEGPKILGANFSADASPLDFHVPGGDNIDNHHHDQGVDADNSGSSFQKLIPDLSPLSLNLSGDVDEAAPLSSEIPSSPLNSSEIVKEVALHTPQQLEDGSSATNEVSRITTSNPSASIDMAKTERQSSLQPVHLNHPKDIQKNSPKSAKPDRQTKQFNPNRAVIDTAAPFESVKDVVTKFGGIVDWKARRANSLERNSPVHLQLKRVRSEIPECQKQSQVAEEAKAQVVRELASTRRIIEELKSNLERAQTEEVQAKQDSELAQLRVNEMQQGIAGESSIATKAQLEVAKARYEAAVAELKSVKEEVSVLQGQYASLLKERDIAVRKAENAASASKDIEKTVEELTLELITTKETLELARAAHLEAEEFRIGAALAKEQDHLTWEKELKKAEEEVERLNQPLLLRKDIKSNLDAASNLLVNLNVELEAYMEAKLNQEPEGAEENIPSVDPQEGQATQSAARMLASIREKLEEVNKNIDEAKEEVNYLKLTASSLKSEIENERSALSNLQQREGMASMDVSSLEAELDWTTQELEAIGVKEKGTREKMVELPKLLQQAAQEADQAKSVAQSAKEELHKAKQEAEQVSAGATTAEIRLRAASKEIEAAKATERLALAAIRALEESELAEVIGGADLPAGVTLSLEEYFNLSKKAYDSEQLAHEKVEIAMSQIEDAEKAHRKCMERVDEACKELEVRQEALRVATMKAEMAKEGKLAMEQELREWRAENEEPKITVDATKSFTKEETNALANQRSVMSSKDGPKNNLPGGKPRKKKRSLIPRIVMFLAKRKQQSTR